MAEVENVLQDRDWAVDMLYGDDLDSTDGDAPSVDLDDAATDVPPAGDPANTDHEDRTPTDEPSPPVDAHAGSKRIAALFVTCVAGVAGILAWTLIPSGSTKPAPPNTVSAPRAHVTASAPAAPAPPPADVDQAIPFTASADCPVGSTSAQSLTDTVHDSAWVCVRGPHGATVDGQVLHVDLGSSHVLTAVTVTPGWVAKTVGGQDEWLQHRVISRLQYVFNDDGHTIVTQGTGNAHGPVTLPLPHPVIASRVTVIVLQTSRPPSSSLVGVPPDVGTPAEFTDSVFGADGAPVPPEGTTTNVSPDGEQADDPVDATFAMSALQFMGHAPK